MLAVGQVHTIGIPRLPSGFLYDHGILFVYIDAAISWFSGSSWLSLRFLSVLCGTVLIAVVFRVGKQWFSARTGTVAALILVLMPEMIARGAFIRMHALLQLLVLIAAFGLYEGIARRDDRRMRMIGVFALSGSLFVHLLSVPLIAVILVGLVGSALWLWRRSERDSFPLGVLWSEGLIVIAAGTLRWCLRTQSGPWGAERRIVTDPRILLDFEYILTHVLGWSYQFIIWPYLLLSIVIAAGGFVMLLRFRYHNSLPSDVPRAFLLSVWLGSLVGLAVFSRWHGPGYVVPLIPFWALLGAAEIDLLANDLEATLVRPVPRVMLLTTVLVAITTLITPDTLRSLTQEDIELYNALMFVKSRAELQDLILTTTPVPAYIELGRADYYIREQGAEAVIGAGDASGIWLSTPVVESPAELEGILDGDRRAWLLIDQQSWDRQFSDGYKRAINRYAYCDQGFAGMMVCVTES
jgi:4-amino-4-deoxy-L-arabinose transferase-like glycosyltransferase